MASQKIDELQLQIGSDASDAIRQLGNLASALNIAADAASRLGTASGNLQRFANGLDRIANANFNKAVDGLTRLSHLKLDNLKDKTVNIQVAVSGASEVERLKYATQDAAKDVSRQAKTIAESLGQRYNVNTEGIKELTTEVKDLVQALAAKDADSANVIWEKMFNTIAEKGAMSIAQIQGVEKEYQQLLDMISNKKFDPSNIGSGVEHLAGLGFLGNLKKGAAGVDSDWSEMMDESGNALESFDSKVNNTADMLLRLAEIAKQAREALKLQPLSGDALESASWDVQSVMEQVSSKLESSIDKHMRNSATKIPIDLDVDQARFEQQIQNAINKATDSKTYTAKPIKFNIDGQKLRDTVEAAFSRVDIAKLPQFASGFEKVSQAISTMNQANFNDTGITKFTNSLKRLISVDTSKFNSSALESVAKTVADISKIGNISDSLNKFVSAIARLANAGDKAEKTATGMQVLVPRLKEAAVAMKKVGEINPTISQFISSLAHLATAGEKAGQTAMNLKDLTTAVLDFLNALQNAPQINDNLAMTIQGLGNLAIAGKKTGQALNEATGSSGSAPGWKALGVASNTAVSGMKKLLDVSLKLGGRGASALGSFMGKLGLIPSYANGIDRTALSFGNLLRSVLPFFGIRGAFDWLKEAVKTGSSLVEIENVIDTAFGSLKKGYEDISGYVYNWAKGTIDAFGVSELAAKQYAGRLMSMFNSSGFDISEGMRDSAAKMSTDLIERAGDVASFYDITVDEAMTKFQAGLAGQTRPLRALGVNMSVANLQAYALSQGITQSWQSMDQATQMALRYQYILNATQYAQGDFARTSGRVCAPCYRKVA